VHAPTLIMKACTQIALAARMNLFENTQILEDLLRARRKALCPDPDLVGRDLVDNAAGDAVTRENVSERKATGPAPTTRTSIIGASLMRETFPPEFPFNYPKQVITDGHTPYPRAIEETLGKRVEHREIACVGNPVEQDHRGIKQRYYPTLGFKAFAAAADFCRASEEVRNYSRPRTKMGEAVSLSDGGSGSLGGT
jgi:DDE domain